MAHFIDGCRRYGVALKATAGLHHPLRHRDAGLQVDMHGFFNVFTAALLAHAGLARIDLLTEVLACEDPGAFRFDADGLRFAGHTIDNAAIIRGRQAFAVSYGSCSFDEPIEDLAALGLV